MRDRVFYSTCFGFIFGVLLRSFLFVNFYFTILLGVISFGLILFFTLVSKDKWVALISIFVLAFSVGILRFSAFDKPVSQTFESKIGQEMFLNGKIIDEPDKRENSQKLTIELNIDSEKLKILATTDLVSEFKYGDEVNFFGKLEKPENFLTDQGKNFDYLNYLRKDGIFYVTSYVTPEIISRGNGNFIKSTLFFIKGKFLEKINLAVSHPESILMGGLILGERSSFSQEIREKLIDTGTIHIVALSGYNVTIVAEWIMKMFSLFPRNFGFGAGIFGIILFVMMAGGQSTAVRAGIMASLALFARATGRNYEAGRGLILAGVAMVAFNPFLLRHDVSFQLSFIATVAVIFFSPKVEKYFMWVTPRFGLRDVVSVTSAAYIFVLPFILYKMGNLSFVALPANVLILPFIPLTMIFGFLTGFVGVISYLLSVPIGFIAYLFLHYELGVIDLFSRFPFTSFSIPNFPLTLTILIYTYFIYRIFGRNIKSMSRKSFT